MTVYVDNFRAGAVVAGVKARWSHLTADSPEELHRFATLLGMQRSWFQAQCNRSGACPVVDGACVHFHYDVVDRRRAQAIALGAKPIDLREMGALISERRKAFRLALAQTRD